MANVRILLVDDRDRVRQDLRTLLTLSEGIEIVGEASNGMQAIQLADRLCPQVVLMDLEMPGMNGYEAARQIKAMHPACRVIALTIYAGAAERQQAFQSGVDDFFIKGAPLEKMLESICSMSALG